MKSWKVLKSVHQFLEHENDPQKFLESKVFVTKSKRAAFLHFAICVQHAETFSDSYYHFGPSEIIFKYKSPSGFRVHHIELWHGDSLYNEMTNKELLLIEKFRQSAR